MIVLHHIVLNINSLVALRNFGAILHDTVQVINANIHVYIKTVIRETNGLVCVNIRITKFMTISYRVCPPYT